MIINVLRLRTTRDLVHREMTQQGSQFKNEIKYSITSWDEWKQNRAENVYVGGYDNEPDIEVVYVVNDENKTLEHIATYNKKEQVLFCDDVDMFNIALKKIVAAVESLYDHRKKAFVSQLYWRLVAEGLRPAIMNDLYIVVDGVTYEFIHHRKEMRYSVKPVPKHWMYK